MKLRLCIIGLLWANICFAQYQTDEGAKIFGGTFGANTNSVESFNQKSTSSTMNFSPYIGYFPNDNLAIGIHVVFSNTSSSQKNYVNQEIVDWNKSQQNMIGLAPFIRYYIPIGPKFKFYGQLTGYNGFGTADTKYSDPQNGYSGKMDISQFGLSITPGFTYFATKRVGLEVSLNALNYNKYKFTAGEVEIQNNDSFSFKLGEFSPNFGLSFYF